MRKKLIPIGNSYGFLIERPILEILGWDLHTILEIRTNGESIRIQAIDRTKKQCKTPGCAYERGHKDSHSFEW